MSDFSVGTQKLRYSANQLDSISGRIDSIAEEARDIILKTRSSISSRLVEYGKATVIHSSISNCATDIRSLSRGLDKSADAYEKYEKYILNKSCGQVENPSIVKKYGKSLCEGFVELLKKAGLVGSAVSVVDGVGKVIKGGKWTTITKNGLKLIKDGNKAIAKWTKTFSNMKRLGNLKLPKGQIKAIWKKKLLGLDDYFKANKIHVSQAQKFSTRWYNNFKKIEADEISGLTKKGAIIGTAISGIVNGISNYEEYKQGEIDGTRAVTETIVETAVDVGTGAVVGTVVATTLATVCGGAPVIAVAAGTWAVSLGMDFLTDKISGGKYDNFTEFASDSLHDVADGISDAAVNCYNKVSKGISAGWKKIFG